MTGCVSTQFNGTEYYERQAVLYMLSFLSIVGTAGNALVLYVFIRRKDHLVSTVYIISLAVVDLTTCLLVMPFTVFMEHVNFCIQSDVICKIYQFLITSNIPFSALIMVAIAFDRYLCICHPWRSAALMNVSRAKLVVLVLAVFSAAIGVCVALMYGVYHVQLVNVDYTNDTSPVNSSVADEWQATTTTTDVTNTASVSERLLVDIVNAGLCGPTELILTENFQWYYQKAYISMYVICLLAVVLLYVAVFWSVQQRRHQRQQRRQNVLTTQVKATLCDVTRTAPNTEMTVIGQEKDARPAPDTNGGCVSKRQQAAEGTFPVTCTVTSVREFWEGTFMANLRTAAMLFVVTVVFIVTFAPGFLMSLDWLPFNFTIFYLYFANNVANPVIYSFMNPNFRADLRRLFVKQSEINSTKSFHV